MNARPPWWKPVAPLKSAVTDTGHIVCRKCGELNAVSMQSMGGAARWAGKSEADKLAHVTMMSLAAKRGREAKKAARLADTQAKSGQATRAMHARPSC